VANSGRLLVGVDIGGTKSAAVIGRDDGAILGESRLEDWASGDPGRDLDVLAEQVRELVQQSGVDMAEVDALGVTAPGPLNSQTGIVIDAPNLDGWRNVPLRSELERRLALRVRIENDANAAALAEWRHGAGRGVQSLVFLTMSTGIGAGLIFDGRLYSGAHFQAGEFGHLPLVPGGRACPCGLHGCFETYAGGAGIAHHLQAEARAGRARGVLERAGGEPERISARTWVEALRAGDAEALAVREQFLDRTAQVLAMVLIALDPERIVLGTIVRENADLFLDELRSRAHARVWPELHDVGIAPSELGSRLPALAALSVAALDGS
jgi:glucokinase